MKRPKFENGEIYHIYNRGVEKRVIFQSDEDRLRFIHDLFEFNDSEPAGKFSEVGLQNARKRKPLVNILAFCLMDNHFHLLLQQRSKNGITEFMRKLGTGYTNFFNLKYERVGSLFQGKFKAIHVTEHAHLLYLPYYIHLNPLDFIAPEWRDRNILNFNKVKKFLEKYRWSSHLDYIGQKNFPSLTQRDFLLKLFGGKKEYEQKFFEWLKNLDIETINDVLLE